MCRGPSPERRFSPAGRGVSREPTSRIQKSVSEADPAGRMRGEGRAGRGGAARPPERWTRRGFGLRLVGGRAGRRGPAQEDQRLEPGRSPRLGDSAAALQLRGSGARRAGTRTAGQPGAGAAGRARQVGGWAGRWAWGRPGPGHDGTGLGMPPAGRGAHPDTPCAGCGRRRGCHGNLQHSGSVAVASLEICPALRTRQSAHPAPRPKGAGRGTRRPGPVGACLVRPGRIWRLQMPKASRCFRCQHTG